VKTIAALSGLTIALILGACAQSPTRSHTPFSTVRDSDGHVPARVCLAEDGPPRTFCVVILGAERTRLADSRAVCSNISPSDLADTYAVMDWIRAHPEAQNDDLGSVIERVLKEMHPCA
jgi:hypothetical protein